MTCRKLNQISTLKALLNDRWLLSWAATEVRGSHRKDRCLHCKAYHVIKTWSDYCFPYRFLPCPCLQPKMRKRSWKNWIPSSKITNPNGSHPPRSQYAHEDSHLDLMAYSPQMCALAMRTYKEFEGSPSFWRTNHTKAATWYRGFLRISKAWNHPVLLIPKGSA